MTTNTITLFPFGSGMITTRTASQKRTSGSSPFEIYVLSLDKEMSVDEMFAQLESEDLRAVAATELGTKWVANTFFANRVNNLATLRMQAGLSQSSLAERLGVSQPLIARWEKEKEPNMQLNTMKKLSLALSIELPELVKILANAN